MPRRSILLPGLLSAGLMLAGCTAANVQRAAGMERQAGLQQGAALLPLPHSVTPAEGGFRLTSSARIGVPPSDRGAKAAAERLAALIKAGRGFCPAVAEGEGEIRFMRMAGLKPEAYRLEVRESGATISASDDAGLFYGAVTLWQLATSGQDMIAGTTIDDAPRFPWRGMMLDSARHFQSPAFVKQLIDWMAAHKLNRLHWHLVDDQGWRIEIPKYPKLTEVSAWRHPATAPGAPPLPRVGGFYTQAEIREIVAYAAARHVTIVPEIEMPGHALAAIRAYPELGVGPVPPPGIESHWGVFPYLYNVDDSTFGFLEDVLRDVMALFPSEYIHVGGDEAVKDQWKASAKIQARIKALGLKDEQALQSWFIARIQRFLSANGRRLIGWDEILDGGIAPGATVMSWRGLDGAVTAAKAGHDSVLSPSPILYLDHLQGSGATEPPGRGGVISLADIYAFDPAPATLSAEEQRHILGLQGNLWTEHIRTEERAAAMAFPRVSAVAELGWSKGNARDFAGFVNRLVPQLERLKPLGLNPSASAFAPVVKARPAGKGSASVALSAQAPLEIRYTLDGSEPTSRSALYSGPVSMPLPARLRAASFSDGRALPGAIDRSFDEEAVRRRTDSELKLCSEAVVLKLEDDAPAAGARAAFLTDIMNPCWIYEGADLDGITEISLDVGQIPFNFQIGKDIEKIRFRPPSSPDGEMEVRLGCEGERIATMPLAPAAASPGVTRLRAPIAPRAGIHDLCITYTAKGPNPLWAVDAVGLVPAP